MTAAEINADIATKKAAAVAAGETWETSKENRTVTVNSRDVAEIQADDNLLIGGTLFSPLEVTELAQTLLVLYPAV